MTPRKFGAFSSSVDPSQLSATIEGLITTIASLLVFFGVLSAADSITLLAHMNQLITNVMILIPLTVSMWGLCKTIFGLLRKAVVAWSGAKNSAPVAPPSLP